MNGGNVIGQTLDGKYRIESEIGKGGMGTVYLATHVGTERPVAVKVIASEFMQRQEFVERFRREARAAGRLRHPNVVNVTDFGFSRTDKGEVAYLVMEYLDGCTLGEVLEEEKQLPLSWTLNILEQVCSAVQEAHEQGIIHRDLKPDNIWLEPNQRGGYTVKVLDFGIAKLEEQINGEIAAHSPSESTALSANFQARATIADAIQPPTIADHRNRTAVSEAATIAQFAAADSEAGTLIQPNQIDSESGTLIHSDEVNSESGTLIPPSEVDLESGTAIFPASPIRSLANTENGGTKLVSEQIETDENLRRTASTSELTRVGAILGTPLYMSPEQCRGEKLTAQSDIYSLGVIAFQMLSGKTPFGGTHLEVMAAHKETAAPPLDVKKIPRKVRQVINFALAKNIAERPPDAQSFASELRAQSEGIGALYRRALIIYSEHLPKFLGLATLLYLPIAVFTLLQLIIGFLSITDQISNYTKIGLSIFITIIATFLGIFCGYLIFGTTTWLVSQILAVPLRPVKVRPALKASWQRRKTFAVTGMMTAVLTLLGYGFCLVPGFVFSVIWSLVAPVVMMENLRGRAALKRSKMLVRRSLRTTIAA
ncbi:MAG: protein kinase, partial [Pyrinomonadaceae bacterium]|nr:protein kinase [Pyrinomonadaceae bacterium]